MMKMTMNKSLSIPSVVLCNLYCDFMILKIFINIFLLKYYVRADKAIDNL